MFGTFASVAREVAKFLKKWQTDRPDMMQQSNHTVTSQHRFVSPKLKLLMIRNISHFFLSRSLCSAANNFRLACKGCFDNCQYSLYSGKLGPVVDLLMHQLSVSEQEEGGIFPYTARFSVYLTAMLVPNFNIWYLGGYCMSTTQYDMTWLRI